MSPAAKRKAIKHLGPGFQLDLKANEGILPSSLSPKQAAETSYTLHPTTFHFMQFEETFSLITPVVT